MLLLRGSSMKWGRIIGMGSPSWDKVRAKIWVFWNGSSCSFYSHGIAGTVIIRSNCDHLKEQMQCLMCSRCLRGERHATWLVQGLSQIFFDWTVILRCVASWTLSTLLPSLVRLFLWQLETINIHSGKWEWKTAVWWKMMTVTKV